MKISLKSLTRLPASASRRVAMNTGILYAKSGITMFISLYATRLVLDSMGDEDFGIFSVVGWVIGMLGFLGSIMASATQRFMSYSQGESNVEKMKCMFNISVILHILIALTVCIVLLIGGLFLFNGTLNIPPERIFAAKAIYYFMIASFVFAILSVPYEAVLNAHENMLYYAIVGIIESVLKLVVAIIVIYAMADKLIVYGAFSAGISIFVMIIMRTYCHRNYEECEFKPRVHFDKKLMKEMTNFAGWSFLGNISSTIANVGKGFVVNKFFGTKVNASEGLAGQINGQLGVFSAALMKALNPIVAKSEGAGNRKLMIDATMMGCKMPFLLFAIFTIPALIEMPYIFNLWLVKVPEYAVIFCRLHLTRSLIEQLFNAIGSSIAAHGNIKKYEIVSSIFCYFPLIATYLLFKEGFPPYFTYLAFIIYAIIAAGISLFFAWNNYGFPVLLFLKKTVLRCIVTFIVPFLMVFLITVFLEEGMIRLFLVVATSMAAFVITAWFVGFDSEEKSKIQYLLEPILMKIFKKRNS